MKNKNLFKIWFVYFLLFSCSKSIDKPVAINPSPDNTAVETPTAITASYIPPLKGPVQLIVTPSTNGHPEFLKSINNTKSRDIIRIAMFHLTENEIIDSLNAAKSRGVTVKVLVDAISLRLPNFNYAFEKLKDGGVDIRASTAAFTISHQKSMVINNSEVFITAINLTKLADTTRDFGLIVHDPEIIGEVINVFEQDWQNAMTQQGLTPVLSQAHLVWSPISSLTKLVKLIASAKKSLAVQMENLGDQEILQALSVAAKSGVDVKIIVPMCTKSGNPKLNFPHLKELSLQKVKTKVMPYPESVDKPYMHSKMMIADGLTAYVGSINFSRNSTSYARELGILFSEIEPIKVMASIFEKDWASAVDVPEVDLVNCPFF